MRIVIACLGAALLSAGCTPAVMLKNGQTGQVARCEGIGFFTVGGAFKHGEYEECSIRFMAAIRNIVASKSKPWNRMHSLLGAAGIYASALTGMLRRMMSFCGSWLWPLQS